MFDALEARVRSLLDALLSNPAPGHHVHLDRRSLGEVAPDATDPSWIKLAPGIARLMAGRDAHLLLNVGLAETESRPDGSALDNLQRLRPWEPPAIYVRGAAPVFDKNGPRWVSYAPRQVDGAVGWYACYLDDDEGRPFPVWRSILLYETGAPASR